MPNICYLIIAFIVSNFKIIKSFENAPIGMHTADGKWQLMTRSYEPFKVSLNHDLSINLNVLLRDKIKERDTVIETYL